MATPTSTTTPRPLPDALVELVAERFRIIGEPMRIRLLDRLREGPSGVGELAEALGASQQNVSKHLSTLHRGGVVGRHKEGNRVVYTVTDPSVFALCDAVCGGLRERVAALAQIVADAPGPGTSA